MSRTADTKRALESPGEQDDQELVIDQDDQELVIDQDDQELLIDQDDQELVMFLERDQLVVDKSRPVSRAALGGRARASLWALRTFAGVVSAMVLYTFVSQVVH